MLRRLTEFLDQVANGANAVGGGFIGGARRDLGRVIRGEVNPTQAGNDFMQGMREGLRPASEDLRSSLKEIRDLEGLAEAPRVSYTIKSHPPQVRNADND